MKTCSSTHLVVERGLHGVEVVRANGDQRSAATNVEVQLVLQIQEATGQCLSPCTPIVDIVRHMDVAEYSAHDVGADHLRVESGVLSSYLRLLTHIHLDALLLGLDSAVHLQLTSACANPTGTSSFPMKILSAREIPSRHSKS